MRFITLFTGTENIHILKDVGLLPYYLHKVCGVDAYIATYKNGEYPFLESDTPGLKLEFIKQTGLGRIFDGINYLRKNSKNTDVLNIYHLNLSSFFYAHYFRMKNKKGRIYLKLDMDYFDLEGLKRPSLKRMVKNMTIRAAHIISCESTHMQKELKKLKVFRGKNILYIADGLYRPEIAAEEQKQNVFLTVGRLGCEQKATEILLDAFARTADKHNWKLRLAGGMEKGFENYVESFFKEHSELKERVQFLGMITDKQQLQREYARARVFVLPSRWESFGIVLAEAAACGAYIITTDVVPAADDITDFGRYGTTVPADDAEALSRALEKAAQEPMSEEQSHEEEEYTLRTFDWESIVKRLYSELAEEKL